MNLSCPFYFADVPIAVQVESLCCFAHLCVESDVRLPVQLLAEFPAILVPLASYDQVSIWYLFIACTTGCAFEFLN